eukprot:scaffold1844_cov133-Isochrysis_galbana.AAC.1
MQATLQEDIPDFLQKLQEVDTSGVLGVGVARVRTSGSRIADARKQQSSCVPNPNVQQEHATIV